MERRLLLLFLHHPFNFTQQPEQTLSFGGIFKHAHSRAWVSHCFHVKHLEVIELWLWFGWRVRIIWGIFNKMNQCHESAQFRRNATQEGKTQYMPMLSSSHASSSSLGRQQKCTWQMLHSPPFLTSALSCNAMPLDLEDLLTLNAKRADAQMLV